MNGVYSMRRFDHWMVRIAVWLLDKADVDIECIAKTLTAAKGCPYCSHSYYKRGKSKR